MVEYMILYFVIWNLNEQQKMPYPAGVAFFITLILMVSNVAIEKWVL